MTLKINLSDLDTTTDDCDWQRAEKLYMQGDPELLEKMLNSDKPIPDYIRKLLPLVVSGTLRIPRRGKPNAILTYKQREKIYDVITGINAAYKNVKNSNMAALINAEEKMDVVDAGDVQRLINAHKENAIAALAAKYGVAESTIKKVVQRFKRITVTPVAFRKK